MRRILLTTLLCLAGATCVQAQTDYSERGATSRLSVGVGVMPGVSIPTGDLDSSDENAPGFALRAGVNITYPVSTGINILLNLGYDMRNLGVKENGSLDTRLYNAGYLFVQPGFSISKFSVSMNVGIPMGGSEPVPNGELDETRDVESDQYNLMLEPRLGATLVLMDEEAYWLGLDLSAGLMFSGIYKDEFQRDPDVLKTVDPRTLLPNNNHLSAHLGFTFQFGIPGT